MFMKKSVKFILAAGLLFGMFFSCSSDDIKLGEVFKPGEPSQEKDLVYCFIEAENKCSRDDDIKISRELCEEVGKVVTSCNSDYGEIPGFVCKWDEEEFALGDPATLSFDMEYRDSNCKRKIFYGHDTLNFEQLNTEIIVTDSVSRLRIYAFLYCSKADPDDASNLIEAYSDTEFCGSFELSPVSPPRTTGALAINTDYKDPIIGDIYYIGTMPSIKDSSFVITNKVQALCNDVKYKLSINGSTTIKAAALGDTVKAVATVVCNGEERELANIVATVVPDPVLSDCVWDRTGIVMYDSISPTRRRVPIMHEDQTLKVSATLSNNYGRCGPNVLYSFNGAASPSIFDTLSLYGLATYGQSSTTNVLSAKAVASCPRNTIPDKVCAGVDSVYVAYHVEKKDKCDGDTPFTIKQGRTVFEFACQENKGLANLEDSFYIKCGCEGNGCDESFDVVAEGGTRKGEGHNGWNFYPGQPAIAEGTLFRYPVPALIKTNNSRGLSCTIW
jgi:hypothetical protein